MHGSQLKSAIVNQYWGLRGLHFETSASEGVVLTMPEGAISIDLENDVAFNNYLKANVQKWYEFVRKVCGQNVPNGQIWLVIGCNKTTAWGIATVSGMSQQTTSKLKFKTLDTASSSATTYTWECSGMVEVRVGPDKHEIEALRNCDDDGHPLKPNTTLRNKCLFVRTMTATLSNNDWAKLMGETIIKDPNTPSGTILDPLLGSRSSGSNAKSSNQHKSHQGIHGTQGYALHKKGGMASDSSAVSIPSLDVILVRK